MKYAFALTHPAWDRTSPGGTTRVPFPRSWGLSAGRLLLGALAGELAAVVFFLASDSVSPVLVRSLQLFLRF
jgi:hypothetical protein